jgi:hypothetical protein
MSLRLCLAALLLSSSTVLAAQDAQSLVSKNLEARGGAAALAAIKNISFEGRTIFPGDFEVTYKETRARAGTGTADRVDFGVQGLNITQGFDGRDGWRINPLQGRKDAEKMSADEARSMADNALIEGPLLFARSDGSRVDYLGRDDFDGTLAYRLKVTQKDGDEFTYWLDPDTYLEIKVDEMRRIRGVQQTTETELGDYEKIAGIYFPMSVESWAQGESSQRTRTIIASGSANGAVSPDIFAEPRGPGSPAKASGEPPDASNKSKNAPAKEKPAAKQQPASPSKSSEGK